MPGINEIAVHERLLIEMHDSGAARRARRRIENMLNRSLEGIIVLAIVGTGLLDLVWHDILLVAGAFIVGFSVAWEAACNAHSRSLHIVEKTWTAAGSSAVYRYCTHLRRTGSGSSCTTPR